MRRRVLSLATVLFFMLTGPTGTWSSPVIRWQSQPAAGGKLRYSGARHYEAVTGRFPSPDRGGVDVRDPQRWNRFGGFRSNPVNVRDPDGHNPLFWLGVGLAGYAGWKATGKVAEGTGELALGRISPAEYREVLTTTVVGGAIEVLTAAPGGGGGRAGRYVLIRSTDDLTVALKARGVNVARFCEHCFDIWQVKGARVGVKPSASRIAVLRDVVVEDVELPRALRLSHFSEADEIYWQFEGAIVGFQSRDMIRKWPTFQLSQWLRKGPVRDVGTTRYLSMEHLPRKLRELVLSIPELWHVAKR